MLLALPFFLYQNCSDQQFSPSTTEELDCNGNSSTSVICGSGEESFQMFFVNNIGRSLGEPQRNVNGAISILNTKSQRFAMIRIFRLGDGSHRVVVEEDHYPWLCYDHSRQPDEVFETTDGQGEVAERRNCVSQIRWFTNRGEKGSSREEITGPEIFLNSSGNGKNPPQTPFEAESKNLIWTEVRREGGHFNTGGLVDLEPGILPYYRNQEVQDSGAFTSYLLEIEEEDYNAITGAGSQPELSLETLFPGENLFIKRVNLEEYPQELLDELEEKYLFLPWPQDIPDSTL